jgi:predicted enzyme related to lactoylglutathione lyase
MIGRLRSVVVDCRQPRALAEFWRDVLGGTVSSDDEDDETWVVLTDSDGRRLAFQQAPEHLPPTFPDPCGSQQFHLDIKVADIDDAEAKVLALGATRVIDAPGEEDFRVYRDPAGHTFCLVWNVNPDSPAS